MKLSILLNKLANNKLPALNRWLKKRHLIKAKDHAMTTDNNSN